MFQYWSAPPSLLRTWASTEEQDAALDDKLHFSSLAVRGGEAIGSLLGRIECYVRAILSSRAADRQISAC
jgi:hypothetical protein